MEELNKVEGEHFDLIIANPPYGKIGANITKKVIDNIDFDEYVNLLPANDYKRNDTHDLYKYVDIDSMKPVNRGFKDAAVTTHMARITKKPHTYISWDEFQIENYTDDSLKKYFYAQRGRVDVFNDQYLPSREMMLTTPIEQSLIFTKRDVSNKHLPYSKKTNSYKWNVEQSVDGKFIIDNTAVDFHNTVSLEMITFDNKSKRDNFSKFIYSADGFRFISKLFTAINCDSRFELTKVFPKVDWTREWTVEEILADYGYTEKEIKEVMDDLVNFKGMD